jgi:hypothetical protein
MALEPRDDALIDRFRALLARRLRGRRNGCIRRWQASGQQVADDERVQSGTERPTAAEYSGEALKPLEVVSFVHRNTPAPRMERNRRLRWGLSARLRRWRAFDGRRSWLFDRTGIDDKALIRGRSVGAAALIP